MPLALGGTVFLVQVSVGLVLFATFQQYVPTELGTGDAWPGILLTAYGIGRFAFETPGGAITDRVGRRIGLLIGFTMMTPPLMLMAVAPSPWIFLGLSLWLGLGNAFLWPAAYALSADLYNPEWRGKVSGFLNVCQLTGWGAGAFAGAMVVESFPMMQFAIALGVVGVAALLVWAWLPSPRTPAMMHFREKRPSMWSVMSVRVAFMVGLILVSSSSSGMLIPAIRPFGEDQLDASFATVTLGLGPALIIGAALYVPAGQVADRFGRILPFVVGQFLVFVSLLALSSSGDIVTAAILAIFVFSGYTISIPAWSSAMMDLAPESHRGALIGLSVAASGLGLGLGPTIGGVVAEVWDAVATLRTAALMSGVAGLGIWIYWKTYGNSRAGAVPAHATADEP